MSAAPSSPIPVALAKLGPLHQHDTGRLSAHLQRVPDPRSRRGRWYPLVGLLLVRACAVVSGARTITEITEWGQRATTTVLELLGIRRHLPGGRRAPSHATLTRLLAALDGDALDAAVGAYLAERDHRCRRHRFCAAAGDRGGRQGAVRLRAPPAAPPAPAVRRHPRPHRHPGPA
ncbi:transposase family protein [Streptomyces sp. NBC_01340]|uniref:transposase family protein n=1 Tax=Streptomyces sp. NBC_01340 TaxID=2903830 RepID=UPI002E15F48C|nr:transposase family protein [Streptomyces sp. NBC_01340]